MTKFGTLSSSLEFNLMQLQPESKSSSSSYALLSLSLSLITSVHCNYCYRLHLLWGNIDHRPHCGFGGLLTVNNCRPNKSTSPCSAFNINLISSFAFLCFAQLFTTLSYILLDKWRVCHSMVSIRQVWLKLQMIFVSVYFTCTVVVLVYCPRVIGT